MKFVFYGRVSTAKQSDGQGYGLEVQRQAVQRYLATIPNAELIGSFEDVMSGSVNTRPGLRAAIDLCKMTGARLTLHKLDRLSRSSSFLLQIIESSVDILITEMPQADKFTLSILACVAQKEREMIGQRTKAGLAIARSRNVQLGNPRLHEARQNALKAVQTQKKAFADTAIIAIKELQSTGISSLSRLSLYLNRRGEKTARGKAWTPCAVSRVLATCGAQGES